jgi:hypothetical protein
MQTLLEVALPVLLLEVEAAVQDTTEIPEQAALVLLLSVILGHKTLQAAIQFHRTVLLKQIVQ